MRDLYSSPPRQVAVVVEFLFELERLVPCVRLARPLLFVAEICKDRTVGKMLIRFGSNEQNFATFRTTYYIHWTH